MTLAVQWTWSLSVGVDVIWWETMHTLTTSNSFKYWEWETATTLNILHIYNSLTPFRLWMLCDIAKLHQAAEDIGVGYVSVSYDFINTCWDVFTESSTCIFGIWCAREWIYLLKKQQWLEMFNDMFLFSITRWILKLILPLNPEFMTIVSVWETLPLSESPKTLSNQPIWELKNASAEQ